MKPLYILLALLINVTVFSQDQNYLTNNPLWGVYTNGGPCMRSGFINYYLSGDSLLNGQNYQKLYSNAYEQWYGGPNEGCPEGFDSWMEKPRGLIREEGEQLYYISFDYSSTIEFLLYDFSLEVGDTAKIYHSFYDTTEFSYYRAVIDSIDSIMIGQDYRKAFHVTQLDYGMFGTGVTKIIEGIGSDLSLLDFNTEFDIYNLSCFMQNEVVVYPENYSGNCELLSSNYYPFPTSNAIWNYKIVGSYNYPYDWSVIDSLGQPMEIDGLDYIEVYQDEDLIGALRDDTVERKVYFHDFSEEHVYYDFTLQVGDSIFYSAMGPSQLDYYKVVEAIDFVQVGSDYRKRWHLKNSEMDLTDIWIEGIGSVHRYGLHYPNQPDIVLDNSTPYFGCFTHDGISYFNTNACYGTCPCVDWLVDVEELSSSLEQLKVFPNPVQEKLQIQQKAIASYTIELYNNASVLLKRETIIGNYEMDLSDYAKGFYYLKVFSKEGEAYFKLVKN